MTFDTPVVLIFFNRPNTLRRVFDRIRDSRPRRLFLAQDGPREGRGDERGVLACRQIVANVDWDCEVSTRYLDANVGCGLGPATAIEWALAQVDRAIILEDDCLPAASFFRYCAEMLDIYESDLRIGMVAGLNHFGTYDFGGSSYGFVKSGSIWGWATWADRWSRHRPDASAIKDGYIRGRLRDDITPIWAADRRIAHWNVASRTPLGESDYWDVQWGLTRHVNSWLTIVPEVNQISNIGDGGESTHFSNGVPRSQEGLFGMDARPLTFPLRHPDHCLADRRYDERAYRILFPPLHERLSAAVMSRLSHFQPFWAR
jgi:hypothetical protein